MTVQAAIALVVLLTCLATAMGSRGQLLVGRLSTDLGRTGGLLATGLASVTLVTCIAAWMGDQLAGMVRGDGRVILLVTACALAVIDLLRGVGLVRAEEPTRSHFAIFSVLSLRQLADAPRLAVFVGAGMSPAVWPALTAGLVASWGAIALAWQQGEALEREWPLATIRRIAAVLIVAHAAFILSLMS